MLREFRWWWVILILFAAVMLGQCKPIFAQTLLYHAGSDFTDSTGLWKADTAIVTGGNISTRGTEFEQVSRWGVFSYRIPVPAGSYKVILRSREVNFSAIGKRIFSIEVEGEIKESALDIYARAGSAPFSEQMTTTVSDGTLNIDFKAGSADFPQVSGVEVIPVAGTVTTTPVSAPKCRPWPLDMTSTRPYLATSQDGFAVAWFCNLRYSWYQQGFSGHKSELDQEWPAKMADAITSIASFDQLWATRMTSGTQTDPELHALFTTIVGNKPPDPEYRVADNGTSITRPTYPVVNGVRKTTSNGRVLVNALCNCAVLAVESTTLWCSVAGNDNAATPAVDTLPADTVSACAKP